MVEANLVLPRGRAACLTVTAQLTHDRLRADLRVAEAAWDHLFDVMPTGCLLTDESRSILKANRAAGVLLNVSAPHLRGRALLVDSSLPGRTRNVMKVSIIVDLHDGGLTRLHE